MTHRLGAAMLAATLTAAVGASGAAPAAGDDRRPPPGPVSWLSTGDSYASGEGISGSGVGTDACAQSLDAYGPRAARLLRDQLGWKLGTTAFSACSGHLLGDWYHEHTVGMGSLAAWTKEQVTGSKTRGSDPRFDVVTFSFGGNDVGFAEVLFSCLTGKAVGFVADGATTVGQIATAVTPTGPLLAPTWQAARDAAPRGCPYTEQELRDRIDRMVGGFPTPDNAAAYGPNDRATDRMTLPQWYTHVANTHVEAGGVLVVLGYPRLFSPSSTWPAWRGSSCALFSAADADMLGRAGEYLEESLSDAVDEARLGLSDGRRIRFVSRLALFDAEPAHTLCTTGTEWLNGPTTGFWDGTLRWMHSFHPNSIGHQATAEAVAGIVRDELSVVPEAPPEILVEKSAPPDEPEPIPEDGAHFDVGDSFDDRCYVAWPTAPTYTTTKIVMTMRCDRQPEQYLFVQVVYGDPNLPITPSTGRVQIRGQIVDMSKSAYGFRQLVVEADEVLID